MDNLIETLRLTQTNLPRPLVFKKVKLYMYMLNEKNSAKNDTFRDVITKLPSYFRIKIVDEKISQHIQQGCVHFIAIARICSAARN